MKIKLQEKQKKKDSSILMNRKFSFGIENIFYSILNNFECGGEKTKRFCPGTHKTGQ